MEFYLPIEIWPGTSPVCETVWNGMGTVTAVLSFHIIDMNSRPLILTSVARLRGSTRIHSKTRFF